MTKIRTFCERHEITDGRLYDCPVCLREERDAAKSEVEWLRNENVTALKRAEDAEQAVLDTGGYCWSDQYCPFCPGIMNHTEDCFYAELREKGK